MGDPGWMSWSLRLGLDDVPFLRWMAAGCSPVEREKIELLILYCFYVVQTICIKLTLQPYKMFCFGTVVNRLASWGVFVMNKIVCNEPYYTLNFFFPCRKDLQ